MTASHKSRQKAFDIAQKTDQVAEEAKILPQYMAMRVQGCPMTPTVQDFIPLHYVPSSTRHMFSSSRVAPHLGLPKYGGSA